MKKACIVGMNSALGLHDVHETNMNGHIFAMHVGLSGATFV